MKVVQLGALGVVLFAATTVRAQAEGEPYVDRSAPIRSRSATEKAQNSGAFLPQTLAARLNAGRAFVSVNGGFDGARNQPIMSAVTEVQLWGPIALRGGAEYSANRETMRPTIGARVQLLNQREHGVDGSVGTFYRPEGFTEPEGEIETAVALGRQAGRLALLGNLVYGQDPEGNERDGEVRVAARYDMDRWSLGFDGRARFAIGAQNNPKAAAEPKVDLIAGPLAAVTIGPLALFTQIGASVLKTTETHAGIAALGGVGSGF